MRIGTRIFLGFVIVIALGFFFLTDWITGDLTPRYRESTEEPLVDFAQTLASLAGHSAKGSEINVPLFRKSFSEAYAREFSANIFGFTKQSVDFRVYITNADGFVVFDSDNGRDEGKDYSQWRDVKLTRLGEYGARTSRDIPGKPDASVMYVAAPIVIAGEFAGVLTVGKPTRNANRLIAAAERKVTIAGIVVASAVIIVCLVISGMMTRPIHRLTDYARAISRGERPPSPELGSSEIAELGAAFDQMRSALEGKQYIENYVQAFTHEFKSPLSAIQGAAELLKEEMTEEQRSQFLQNITAETARMQLIIDQLLELASLENRRELKNPSTIVIEELLNSLRDSLNPKLVQKNITIDIQSRGESTIIGEEPLLSLALSNLLDNAVEFSPKGGSVHVEVNHIPEGVECVIEDDGPGIPEYALERVFERFYSLKRPESGKKSSGLGLSIVKEIAQLHSGDIALENKAENGCRARVWFGA